MLEGEETPRETICLAQSQNLKNKTSSFENMLCITYFITVEPLLYTLKLNIDIGECHTFFLLPVKKKYFPLNCQDHLLRSISTVE